MSYLAVLLSCFATPRIHFSLCLVAATFPLHVACFKGKADRCALVVACSLL